MIESLDHLHFLLLMFVALLTSTLSGIVGMGGGILLLSFMAPYFPMEVLVPLHGAIQWTSNSSRVVLHRQNVHKPSTLRFLGGAIVGAGIGSQIVLHIPDRPYKIILAIFLLAVTWLPKVLKTGFKWAYKFQVLGAIATFLSLFVGATGPILAPFYLNEGFNRYQILGSKAATQWIVHSLKIIVYISLGFSFSKYAYLLVAMVLMTVLGNLVGKKVLHYVPEGLFLWIFKIILSVLAFRMLLLSF